MYSHVGLHLERFSLFALPRSVKQEEDHSDGADSDKANMAFEGFRDDDFDSDIEIVGVGDGEHQYLDANLLYEDFYVDDEEPIRQDLVSAQNNEKKSRWTQAISTVQTRIKADKMLEFFANNSYKIQPLEKDSTTLRDRDVYTHVIAKALEGKDPVKTAALIEILPRLRHGQLVGLRLDYKDLVRTGSEKKGVNVAKHIKSRLEGTGPIAEIAYATALGRWESEVFWIMEWCDRQYQSEFLIETLLGRTKQEIKNIQLAYGNMSKDGGTLGDLLEDKMPNDSFKYLILLSIVDWDFGDEENAAINQELVEFDTSSLKVYRNFQNGKPGERDNSREVIEIMVRRTNSHLKAVFQMYAERHNMGFIKDLWREQGEDFIRKNPLVITPRCKSAFYD